jgi:hypothetical protein
MIMAIQSAVRCVEANPAESGAVTAVRADVAHMDALATFQALERELTASPIAVTYRGRSRFLKRAGLALVCSGLAVLIGGLLGTLSSL